MSKLINLKRILCFCMLFSTLWLINFIKVSAYPYPQDPPTIESARILQSTGYAPCVYQVQVNNIKEEGSGIFSLTITLDGFDSDGNFVGNAWAGSGYTDNPLFSTKQVVYTESFTSQAPTATYYISKIYLEGGGGTTYRSPYTADYPLQKPKMPPTSSYTLISENGDTCEVSGAITIYGEETYDINIALNNPNIASLLERMEDGQIANIYSSSRSTIVPKAAFDAIKGTNKKMNVSLTSGFRWLFDGKNITGVTKDIDCNVSISAVQGDMYGSKKKLLKFAFPPNGALPGKATIKFKSDYLLSLYKAENLFLYYLDGKNPVLVNTDVVTTNSNGNYWCQFDITHNSNFLLSQEKLSYRKPFVKINTSTLVMQIKQSSSALKVIDHLSNDKVLKWTSSKPSIVAVNKKTGRLTAKKPGVANITVQLKSGAKSKCRVKVQKGSVKTKSISVILSRFSLKKGATYKIEVLRKPLTANDGKITFRSSKPKVAGVNSKGTIKALKKGKTTIIIRAGKKVRKVFVTVYNK